METLTIEGLNPHDAGTVMHYFCEICEDGCSIVRYNTSPTKLALRVTAQVQPEHKNMVEHIAWDMLLNGWEVEYALDMLEDALAPRVVDLPQVQPVEPVEVEIEKALTTEEKHLKYREYMVRNFPEFLEFYDKLTDHEKHMIYMCCEAIPLVTNEYLHDRYDYFNSKYKDCADGSAEQEFWSLYCVDSHTDIEIRVHCDLSGKWEVEY